jgi:membrane protein insertase Oxa1/YidC/SpoIIIJ
MKSAFSRAFGNLNQRFGRNIHWPQYAVNRSHPPRILTPHRTPSLQNYATGTQNSNVLPTLAVNFQAIQLNINRLHSQKWTNYQTHAKVASLPTVCTISTCSRSNGHDVANWFISSTSEAATATPFNLYPTDLASIALNYLHQSTHLDWALTILLTSFVMRCTLTLPLTTYQHMIAKRMIQLKPLISGWERQIANATRKETRNSVQSYSEFKKLYLKRYSAKISEIQEANGIRPLFAVIAPFVQAPIWIIMSMTLRRMSGALNDDSQFSSYSTSFLPDFAAESFLWLPSLASVDPTWIGPLAVCALNLVNIQLATFSSFKSMSISNPLKKMSSSLLPTSKLESNGNLPMSGKGAWSRKTVVLYLMRLSAILMIPIAKLMPGGVIIYWLGSAAFSVVQNVILKLIFSPAAEATAKKH